LLLVRNYFFALETGISSVDTLLLSTDNNGLTPWNGDKIVRALDVTSMIRAWDDGEASGKVTIKSDTTAADYLSVFLYDHYPKGDEFVAEEETLLDGHKLGVCGSYVLKDGTWVGKEWEGHPYDCTDQVPGDQCMFCKGRANDKIVRLCLERLGAGCNRAFNTPAREAFCNLEFECPASTVSFSLFLLVSILGGLFYVA